ncbi:MAG: transglutaminase [Spirochaetales bacterium]|nr:transglutaminase [Spirochaetales bacterium]
MNILVRSIRHRATIPTILFAGLVCLLVLSLNRSDKPPRLESIAPEIGSPGGVMVLRGRYFGRDKRSSSVIIAGKRPTTSSYLEWGDTQISVQIPADVGSGMVNVTTRLGISGGILFTNANRIPVVLSETTNPGEPHIEKLAPKTGVIGTPVTLTGLNFGLSRGGSRVLFAPLAVAGEISAEDDSTEYVPASEIDSDYESWTDQSIRVRVPDGATSGNIRVETDRGISNSVYFEIAGLPGTKVLSQKRGYQILFSIEISNVRAEPNALLDIWVPGVLSAPEQRNIEHVKIPEPLWTDYFGLSRYQFQNIQSGLLYRINQTYWLDRYAIETNISAGKVARAYDTERKLYKSFTVPTPLMPSDDESISSAAWSAIGRERSPFLRARAIYLFLIKKLVYDEKPKGEAILENFIAASADSYGYSLLFCTMVRAIGIPARPVAGFIIYGDRKAKIHYWAEFYIEGFGWVPVDPTLGDSPDIGAYPNIEDPAEYFFGGLGTQHLAFTKGVIDVKPLSSDSKIVQHKKTYSLQTIHEEGSSGLRSYSSEWGDLQVIDLW